MAGLMLLVAIPGILATGCGRQRDNPFDPGSPDFIPPPVIREVVWEYRSNPQEDSLSAHIRLTERLQRDALLENRLSYPDQRFFVANLLIPSGIDSFPVSIQDTLGLPTGTYTLAIYYADSLLGQYTYDLVPSGDFARSAPRSGPRVKRFGEFLALAESGSARGAQ